MSWNAIASHGNILSQILVFVFTPSFSKLWTLSRSSRVDLERSWCKTLDLSSLNSEKLHSAKELLELLAQPRWKRTRTFHFPQAWARGMFSITINLLRKMKRLLPDLQELDLLAYTGARWTEAESCRRVAAEAWLNLRTLKLEVFWYDDDLAMLAQLVNLQVLHIKQLTCSPQSR